MAHATHRETLLPTPPRTCVVSKTGKCSKKSKILETTQIVSAKWSGGGRHSYPIWSIIEHINGTITITTSHEKLT
eukprot:1645681-Ditylum_brightwellii.AAC.1